MKKDLTIEIMKGGRVFYIIVKTGNKKRMLFN